MSYRMTSLRSKTVAVPLAVVLGGFGLTACSNDTAGSEAGADVESIQEEPKPLDDEVLVFGEDFDDAMSFVGQTVTVSADVSEIVDPGIFKIAGTENTTLEPLLIVADPATDVEEDAAVQVTGTVYKYDPDNLTAAEGVLGDDFDISLFDDFEDDEPYIVATDVSPVDTP